MTLEAARDTAASEEKARLLERMAELEERISNTFLGVPFRRIKWLGHELLSLDMEVAKERDSWHRCQANPTNSRVCL